MVWRVSNLKRVNSSQSQLRRSEAAAVVAAVVYLEEQLSAWQTPKAFMEDYTGQGGSFFSKHDWWFFQAITDDRTCYPCNSQDKVTFNGDELLGVFPWLEIGNEDTIFAWVHPHCRCILIRISDPLDYLGLDLGVAPDWMPGSDNVIA
jgi:hypothetical protein